MKAPQHTPLTHLGKLSVEEFLEVYWQKKPVLIRQALTDLPYLPADELAGFALEEEVESRLIIETPRLNEPLNSVWQCLHGPISDKQFSQLPAKHWTLLVQAVNQLSEDIHHFLHQFRFVPNWRLDDVMVSYAVAGGNVGPHFDYYDVFLVQAQGQRKWKLGQFCDSNTALAKDAPLKLLTEFHETDSYIVEPGDVLYIPPGYAHWGVALNECMTYSVGFRAPSRGEMLLDLADQLSATDSADHRFSDHQRTKANNPGEISSTDIALAKQLIHSLISDDDPFNTWFGGFITQPKRMDLCYEPKERGLRLAPFCTAAYIPQKNAMATLFINGDAFTTTLDLAKAICSYQEINSHKLSTPESALIEQWQANDWLMGND